jgi:hypothetical protein
MNQTSTPRRLQHTFAILVGAVVLCWPAFYNRYPLLYPDSISYIGDGHLIARALLALHPARLPWMRSPLYSLGIFPFHWARNPWPVVALQGLITAWILWLIVRSLVIRRTTAVYLAILTFLSLFTGLSWVVSWLLPDILGPVLYLSIYLLVFARNTLSRREAALVSCLIIWSTASHLTHLMLGVFLSALLCLLVLVWPTVMRPRAKAVGTVAMLVAAALALQVALTGYLSGSPSLTGKHPPFLMARLLSDGPARELLQTRCGDLQWTICKSVDALPTDSDEFLWGVTSVWTTATPAEAGQIRYEELPLLWATLRAYPGRQVRISLANFWQQLHTFDIEEFGNNPWAESQLNNVMPGSETPYRRGLQSRDLLPTDFFSDLQQMTVGVSLLVLAISLPLCWRRSHIRLLGLSAIVLSAVVANAFLTGVLSVADSRYQVRVIWLLPLLAILVLLRLVEDHRTRAIARRKIEAWYSCSTTTTASPTTSSSTWAN